MRLCVHHWRKQCKFQNIEDLLMHEWVSQPFARRTVRSIASHITKVSFFHQWFLSKLSTIGLFHMRTASRPPFCTVAYFYGVIYHYIQILQYPCRQLLP